ncbi:DUF6716 putative glycosyltransferase [Actinocorallia populi]|uniref:DUF6716 putative glycosyltransferase n=1 Tax=Actinocorallia populi TaxID=2079200 RepID=UPI000D09147A|nr:DUF6716 putative glycosyltransferase [Actinocorallia populi]
MRLLAVADSDSYLKWAAALLRGLPGEHRLVVVRSPITPSAGQRRAAVGGVGDGRGGVRVPEVVTARRLRALLRGYDPDAVLLACTGPVVRALSPWVSRDRRRVLVTGLPGISVPASEKAWRLRAAADLFVVHSGREVAEFDAIARDLGLPGRTVRATLPFLHDAAEAAGPRDRIVFATQAKVPERREERERILYALADLARARPELSVVVKLRARAGEEQTHREDLHYETLWREMPVDHGLLRFDAGPMHAQLARAAGFTTVSSTAALEAIAAGVPLLVLSDFGVGAKTINLVFEGSGLLGTLDELVRSRFRGPDAAWCAENYFHPEAENDWVPRLAELVAGAADLPRPAGDPGGRWARTRASLRVELPPAAYRGALRLRRALR